MIDGPQSITGVHRQVIGLKRIALTDILITKLPRNSTQKNLLKAWNVSICTATHTLSRDVSLTFLFPMRTIGANRVRGMEQDGVGEENCLEEE